MRTFKSLPHLKITDHFGNFFFKNSAVENENLTEVYTAGVIFLLVWNEMFEPLSSDVLIKTHVQELQQGAVSAHQLQLLIGALR